MDSNVIDATSQAVKRKRAKNRAQAIAILVVLAAIGITLVFGPFALRSYDKGHPSSVQCTVTSAQGTTGSFRSSRGAGGSFDQVVILTENCGKLVLRQGVTASNKAALAAQIAGKSEQVFIVGAASKRLRGVLQAVNQSVIVMGIK